MTIGAGRRGNGIVTAVSMLLAAVVAAAAMATVTASQRDGNDRGEGDERGRSDRSYAIGTWGDLPYSDLQAMVGVPNLIADMNRQDLEFGSRRRSQGGQRRTRLHDSNHLQRRNVCPSPRLPRGAEGAGHVYTRGQ